MKLICTPNTSSFPNEDSALKICLFGNADASQNGSVGAAVFREIFRKKLAGEARAWDLLSLALSVVTADLAGHRSRTETGWTRDFELEVAVGDPEFWNTQTATIKKALDFLTTDRWRIHFIGGGARPPQPNEPIQPDEDSVVLLSGGLDSLVGAIDLSASGKKPFAVSQTVRGDAEKQVSFARNIGGGLRHLQLNHNAIVPDPEEPPSQRARSLNFIAYGIFVATTLASYRRGEMVTLYVCENGFIAINPPLTGARLGSLSTRTMNPVFLRLVQSLIDSAGLRVRIENPYQLMTKGEMLSACANQSLLEAHASLSTSCGRFMRYGYKHCGRCMPCQIRRAAFRAWGFTDSTEYIYEDLGRDDADYAGFDDVRSAAMAIAEVESIGLDDWLGVTLSSTLLGDVSSLKAVVSRGLAELAALHHAYGVR
ncbi:MAG TPA: Qat anti-phage system QueC-like protein QatC [Pyrinomonadaceae bacterium]|nr:Qat anti-phage system QueC-like protein QatC [Pyrinomonadaceae bacterium]